MSTLPTHLREKIETQAEAIHSDHRPWFYQGAESLWRILTEMSENEKKAIEFNWQGYVKDKACSTEALSKDSALFGLSLGRVKAEMDDSDKMIDNMVDSQLRKEYAELEAKLAIATEALKGLCEDYYDMSHELRVKYAKPSAVIAREALASIGAQGGENGK